MTTFIDFNKSPAKTDDVVPIISADLIPLCAWIHDPLTAASNALSP
jgi:hypothetical protein